MAIRNIRPDSDDILRKKSKTVEQMTPALITLLDDMVETLTEAEGIGLAAPQVGILRRIVVVSLPDDDILYELINPEIIETYGTQEKMEGCLSVNGIAGVVERPSHVKVRALDRYLKPYEINASGLLAIALTHEIDHLDGILYTDRAYNIMDTNSQEYKDYIAKEEREEEAEKRAKRRAWRAKRRAG